MKRIAHLLAVMLFTVKFLFGQDNTIYPTNTFLIPPAPTAAALGEYGEYPVDYSTGTPDINIPFGNLNCGNLSIPISISYQASGIKVEQKASPVGLGWVLNAGGVITRSVNGLPDDVPNGYLSLPSYQKNFPYGGWANLSTLDKRVALQSGYDNLPDEFFYNFNGISGAFVFDTSGIARCIPYRNIKIEARYSRGLIDSFKVTTEDGTQYYFKDGQISYDTYSYNSSWFLSKIVTPGSSHEIVLSYVYNNYSDNILNMIENDSYSATDYVVTSQTNQHHETCKAPPLFTDNSLPTYYQAMHLQKISYPEGYVILKYSSRIDVSQDSAISEIDFFNLHGALQRKMVLTTSYWKSTYDDPIDSSCKYRLRLDAVYEEDASGETKPPYRFNYFSKDWFPTIHSASQDHWGYFNGRINAPQNGNWYWGLIPSTTINGTIVGYGNRNPDTSFTRQFVLTNITNPTGGYIYYQFESNQYYTFDAGTVEGGGIRLKKMVVSDGTKGNAETKYFSYGDGFAYEPNYQSFYSYNNGSLEGGDNICLYAYVGVSTNSRPLGSSNGSIVSYPNITITSAGNENGTSFLLYNFNNIGSGYSYGGSGIPYTPIIGNNWAAGLLSEKIDYDVNNNLVEDKVNYYSQDASNAFTVYGLAESMELQDNVHGNDNIATAAPSYSSVWYHLDSTVDNLYNKGASNYISKREYTKYDPSSGQTAETRTFNSDGTAHITDFKYPDDYSICTSCVMDDNTAAIRQMQNDKLHMSDKVIESTERIQKAGGSVVTIGSTLITYKQFTNNQVLAYQEFETENTAAITNFANSNINQGTFTKDTHYTLRNSIPSYDRFSNPLTFQKPNDIPVSYIWNGYGTHPIAEIKNATPDQCFYNSFEPDGDGELWETSGIAGSAKTGEYYTTINNYLQSPSINSAGKYVLSFWSKVAGIVISPAPQKSFIGKPDANGWIYHKYDGISITSTNLITISGYGAIDEVRIFPEGAMMKTVTYDPLFGEVNSFSDENSLPTSFEYDNFGRLAWAYDDNKNILSHTSYHYYDPNDLSSHNYVNTYAALVPGLTQADFVPLNEPSEVRGHDDYYDGLGRLIQSVDSKESPSLHDMVQAHVFDDLGRESTQYLPFAESNAQGTDGFYSSAVQDDSSFFVSQTGVSHTTYPFSQSGYDNSPLNRVVEQSAPGASWTLGGGHTVQTSYRTNSANEVLWFKNINNQWDATKSYYVSGSLYAVDVKDENGNESITFKDKLGRIVCEEKQKGTTSNKKGNIGITYPVFASTYYIYNDFGNLIYAIQPQGIIAMQKAGSYLLTSAIITNFTFQYLYDSRHRMNQKQVPGGGIEFSVYDDLDRVALTQDANLRQTNQWKFIKYDVFSRPVMTGLYIDNTNTTLSLMSSYLSSFYLQSGKYHYEKRISASPATNQIGYSNQSFPTMNYHSVETVNFYDDYDFDNNGSDDFTSSTQGTALAIGKPTGGYVLMLGKSNFVKNAIFYDDRYRAVETDGISFTGSTEKTVNKYDFTANLLQAVRTHGGNYSVTLDFSYDHAGRKTDEYLTVNGYPQQWVTHFEYNELGQLADKNLNDRYVTDQGNTCVGCQVLVPQQSVQYLYNERGWLTDINDINKLSTSDSDYFAEKLHYDDGTTTHSSAQFNGNIAYVEWGSDRDGAKRQYYYKYDPLNRLTAAYYQAYAQGKSVISEANRYSVSKLAYDDNGNILTMDVRGVKGYNSKTKASTYNTIDSLTYAYTGNILNSVNDGISGGLSNVSDFRNGTNNAYAYDLNGNIINEHNKNLSIFYNDLNLPDSMTKGPSKNEVIYYDASGSKLKEIVTANNTVDTTKYFGDIIQEAGQKTRIQFSDGYALEQSVPHQGNKLTYFYYIKDHLGNTRIVFRGDSASTGIFTLTMEPGHDSVGRRYGEWQNVNAARSTEAAYQGSYSARVSQSTDTTMTITTLTSDSTGSDSSKTTESIGPYIILPATQGDSIKVSVYYYAKDTTDTRQTTAQRRLELPITIVPAMMPLITTGSEGYKSQKKMVAGAGLQLNIGAIFNSLKKRPKNLSSKKTPATNDSARISFKVIDTSKKVVKTWSVATPVTLKNSGKWNHSSSAFKISLPDSTQPYTIQIALVNNNAMNVFFDTMRIVQNTPSGPIVQENDYYPFGNLIDGLAYQNTAYDTNDYKYNGKLLDNDFREDIYDYNKRYFDPQIGRFLEVDGLASKFTYMTDYQYASNDPIKNIDLDGLEGVVPALLTGLTTLIAEVGSKGNKFLNGEINVAKYNQKTNGKSMPLTSAAANGGKGTVTAKILNDVDKQTKPMQDNFAIGGGAKSELPGGGEVSAEAGTDGSRLSFSEANGAVEGYIATDLSGNTTSGIKAAGKQVAGKAEKNYEVNLEISAPIPESQVTPYVYIKASPEGYKSEMKSDQHQSTMDNIKFSYGISFTSSCFFFR